MPRGRTSYVAQAKQRLLTRLESGRFQPGDRFLSLRDVAELFGVSYQTAHRLVTELCEEGKLERRPGSGTYLPGELPQWKGVQLLLEHRAQRPESFGEKLFLRLRNRLQIAGIDWTVDWVDGQARLAKDRIAVLWECPEMLEACCQGRHPAILINDRPSHGLRSLSIDSVAVDDFSGGAAAAELLLEEADRGPFVVIAGPDGDRRSVDRAAGFQSIVQGRVIRSGGWNEENGYQFAEKALAKQVRGIFCCNDSLASGVIRWAGEHHRDCPPIVGFDDAPVAERINLTTLAIPWDELVETVVSHLRRRLSKRMVVSSHHILAPYPILRGFGRPG